MGAIVKEELKAGAHRQKDFGWEENVKCCTSLVENGVCLDEMDELLQFACRNALLSKQDLD
jgi:hypothetical protein